MHWPAASLNDAAQLQCKGIDERCIFPLRGRGALHFDRRGARADVRACSDLKTFALGRHHSAQCGGVLCRILSVLSVLIRVYVHIAES